MESNELGRVLDPEAFDASSGARARLSIKVPRGWLAEPCEIKVLVPRRLACARCDGGGCDGCGKSGALLAPLSDDARRVCVYLGPVPQGSARAAIRVTSPFGSEIAIDQLILVIELGDHPSPGVTRRTASTALAPPRRAPVSPGVALIALAAAAAILLSLFGR